MYILYRQFILFSLILLFQQFPVLNGQNLDSLLMEQMEESTEFTSATFKATRILNGHSIERTNEGQLDFRISHRFGTINSGAYEFFGLDQAHIHLSLEYGIRDWLMVGIGRGTFEKTVNGFTKLDNPDNTIEFHHRLSFAHQIQIARKFTPGFSFQITPSYLHQNLVAGASDPNDLFALGAGSRLKLSKRISLNGEYFYLPYTIPWHWE